MNVEEHKVKRTPQKPRQETPNDPRTLIHQEAEVVQQAFSASQLEVIMAMIERNSVNITDTINQSIGQLQERMESMHFQEEVPRSYSSEEAPTRILQEVEDDLHRRDVTKILQRHAPGPEEVITPAQEAKRDQEALDKEIQDLRATQELNRQTHGVRMADASMTIAKAWQRSKISDDVHTFPEWNRKAIAYFSAVGLPMLPLMDPFSVPSTLNDWQEADRTSYANELYQCFATEVANYGEVQTVLRKSDSFSAINAAFLATINGRKGLRATVTAVLESTVEYATMKSCLMKPEELAHPGAIRQMYFGIFKFFMLNTEDTRLRRLSELTTNMKMEDPESIKNFADRLQAEANLLNMMSKDIVVSDALILSILKKVVFSKFSGGNDRYWNALEHLKAKTPNFSVDDLVCVWNDLFLSEKGRESYPVVNAFQAADAPVGPENFSYGKRKIADLEGRPLCFQFLKNNKCTYGSKCKYSHSPPAANKVYANLSLQQVDDEILRQGMAMANFVGKKQPPRGALRTAVSASYKKGISNYKKNFGKSKEVAKANAVLPDVHFEDHKAKSSETDETESESESEEYSLMLTDQEVDANLAKKPGKVFAVLDSGATVHICGNRRMFTSMSDCDKTIRMGGGRTFSASERGTVMLYLKDSEAPMMLYKCIYMPGMPTIVSVGRITNNSEYSFTFVNDRCDVSNSEFEEVSQVWKSTRGVHKYFYLAEIDVPVTERIPVKRFRANSDPKITPPSKRVCVAGDRDGGVSTAVTVMATTADASVPVSTATAASVPVSTATAVSVPVSSSTAVPAIVDSESSSEPEIEEVDLCAIEDAEAEYRCTSSDSEYVRLKSTVEGKQTMGPRTPRKPLPTKFSAPLPSRFKVGPILLKSKTIRKTNLSFGNNVPRKRAGTPQRMPNASRDKA